MIKLPTLIVALASLSAAQQNPQAYSWLQELSDTIGPRLTGSPEAAKACDWAVRTMKAIGLEKVHQEQWQMSRGWRRKRAEAALVSPIYLPLNITSYGWTGSTTPVEAELVLVNRDSVPEEVTRASTWAGKVVLVAPLGPKAVNPMRAYSELAGLASAAQTARAVAVIYRDSRPGPMLTHTGPVVFGDANFSIPVVDIAAEHQMLIERLLKSGQRVRMKIDIENEFSAGPVPSSNVIGEITGREHPEQVLILGAHLDSWDLGEGAIDDGFGVVAMLGAVDAIVKSGVKPRRTIRVILFTGEEQGLLGSRAWVRDHSQEVPNLLGALVLDWGQGPIKSLPLAGRDELKKELQGLEGLKIEDGYLSFTDAYSFTLAGVPGLAFLQESRDYTMLGHSAADTLDKVDAEVLSRNSAVVARTAFWIADHPIRLGTVWPSAKVVRKLTDDGQRTLLQLFGLWPFGR